MSLRVTNLAQVALGHAPSRSGVRVRASVSGRAFVGEWPGHSNEPRQAVERTPRWLSRVGSNSRDRYPPMLSELHGFDRLNFEAVYLAGNGEERTCFNLPKRETLILVSGYSVAHSEVGRGSYKVKKASPSDRQLSCFLLQSPKSDPHFVSAYARSHEENQ